MPPAPSETLDASVLTDIIAVQQQVATAELSPLAIMELITQSAARLTAADGAILNIPEGDSYIVCSAVGCSQSQVSARFSREHNLTAVADDSRQILLCSDISADPRADQRLRRQFSAKSIIIVPLMHAGKTVGILNVISLRTHAFTPVHGAVLQLTSGFLASALSRAFLHREMQSAARRTEMRLQAVVDNKSLLLWSVDKHGFYTYCEGGASPRAAAPSERVGKSIFDVFADQPLVCNCVRKALAGIRSQALCKIEDRWYEMYVTPYLYEGKVENLVGISLDVTDRVEAEELRQERLDALMREKSAMHAAEVKSRLLASVSHELRTPLNGVIGLSKLLMDTPLNEAQRSYVSAVAKCGDMLLALANDVLDVSKAEAGKMVLETIDFNLPALLVDVQEAFFELVQSKQIVFTATLDPHLPHHFRGDPMRLRQVLMNLASNAVKFTEHGSVNITVEGEGRDDERYTLRFTVRDTGIGISAEALTRIFESFSQAEASTARRFGGTGLGLSICKHLVSVMQGTIDVHSEIGQGSSFWFELPMTVGAESEQALDAREPAILRNPDGTVAHLRVLVADDNSVNQVVAQKMLEKMGHEALIAGNGKQVLELLETTRFDLILMDCQMPELDGYKTTEIIRATAKSIHRDIPIVAMTASAMPGDMERCLRAGMNGYVSKPINPVDLEQAVSKVRAL